MAEQPFSAMLLPNKRPPPCKLKNSERRSREYLLPAEVRQLIEAAKKLGRHGHRDAVLIMMAYRHALRVGELVNLRWDQVNFPEGKLHVNRLKHGEASIHYLEGDEVRALRKLQRDYPDSPYLFCSERKGPLSCRSAHHIIARAGQEAGLGFPVHPHMLRHAKGYQLASKGIDTRAIQGYFGHRNINHTVVYTRLDASRFKGFGKD